MVGSFGKKATQCIRPFLVYAHSLFYYIGYSFGRGGYVAYVADGEKIPCIGVHITVVDTYWTFCCIIIGTDWLFHVG